VVVGDQGASGRRRLRVQPLRAGGAAGCAAGGRLPGLGSERDGSGPAVVRRLRVAADPDGEAAVAALALVGEGRGDRRGAGSAGPGDRSQAPVPGAPGGRQPSGRPGPGRAVPALRAGHPAWPGGGGRVAAGALPPGAEHRAAAATLAGAGRGGVGGDTAAGPGHAAPGRARHPVRGRLRGQRRGAAAGDRRGDPALPAVRHRPHHQPHAGLWAPYRRPGARLRRGGPGTGSAPGPELQPGGRWRDPGGRRIGPAGPPPHPGRRRPALQPPPLRRRQDHRGVQRPPAPGGRPGHPWGELLAVVGRTMQPASTSLWLRPTGHDRPPAAIDR